jgi:hypothetical protein
MKPGAAMCHALLIGILFWCTAPARAEQPAAPPLSAPAKDSAKQPPGRTGSRTTLLVPLPAEPGWQDMAFLAAIPAATVVNQGAPSLVALEAAGTLTPEIQDYLRRYHPDEVVLVGSAADSLVIAGRPCGVLKAGGADEAACALSNRFWRTSATAVVCPEGDYEAALVAAPLAARLRAPLLFAGGQGLSPPAAKELRRLAVRELIVVGKLAAGTQSLKQGTAQVTQLATARDVMAWARNRKWPVAYLAALNPLDRNKTVVKKLSLAGAMLAAGRDGLVAPLSYDFRWKVPFNGEEMDGNRPAGVPRSRGTPKTGRIALGGREYSFLLTGSGKPIDRDLTIHVDRDGDGKFAGSGEGPFVTGDTVELDGNRHAITLDADNGVGKADVRLTWPTAEQLVADLRGDYDALGTLPEYLCLVGFPDAVPQAIFGKGDSNKEQPSDLPYANADDDPFAEICVSRVIAENASLATLYASRALTYRSLLDPKWQDRACQACWENTSGKRFENVGFDASYRHTKENLKWLVPPAQGKQGERAQCFDQDSPLAHCAALTHENHSWWRELGETFDWNAKVLLAPVVVESGGCSTATLDCEADFHSVVARLLRNGAVSFSGNSREGIAECELQRQEFWNGVLAGQTLGQAHRRSMNSAQVTILDNKEDAGGGYQYQLRIRMQFGDPALAMHLPARPRSAPARCVVSGDTVTVHAPAEWWPVKMHVPADWKKWADKDLYVLRGAGTYARRTWCGQEYDKEEMYVTAEFTTRRHVAKIEQVQKPPAPLGWNGSYYVDEHADGSRTYRWSVRLADFDQVKAAMVNAVKKLEYRIFQKD